MTDPGTARPRLLDAEGPVILDAAAGTRLFALGLRLDRDDPSLWNLGRPEAVADLHARDLAAGADALLTNTFGANRHWLARFGRASETVEVNRRAVEIARAAPGAGRFILGAIGPAFGGDPRVLREQAEALAESGVDALVFETQRIDEIAPALDTFRHTLHPPVIVSLFDWPNPAAEAVQRMEDLGVSALGVNCVDLSSAVEAAGRLAAATRLPLWIKPSGGAEGRPEAFAAAVPRFLAARAHFLGGCCGTDDAHVAALRAACYDRSR